MYPAGNLFIPVAHGRLEAILKEPRAHAADSPDAADDAASTDAAAAAASTAGAAGHAPFPRGAALVLHPHPLHGGTMHNKVVFRAARALNDAGLVTLRINFRGVGQSTGAHDEGRGERDDARAALDYLARTYPDLPLTLAGFSFGARVCLEFGASDSRIKNLVGIGTPVNMYDFQFLREIRRPMLLVHGERDEFGDIARLQTLARELLTTAPVELRVIPGAGHFFDGQLDEMSRVIREWMERQFKG